MNIPDVLSMPNVEASQDDPLLQKSKGMGLNNGSSIFAFLFNNFIDLPEESKGQASEELMDILSQTDLNSILSGGSCLYDSSCIQVLQNFIPAGKEANSGQNGSQNTSKDFLLPVNFAAAKSGIILKGLLSREFGKLNLISLMPNMDSEQTGIGGPESGERFSLDLAELDKYIKTVNLLKELNGEVRQIKHQDFSVQSRAAGIQGFFFTGESDSESAAVIENGTDKGGKSATKSGNILNKITEVPGEPTAGGQISGKQMSGKQIAGGEISVEQISGQKASGGRISGRKISGEQIKENFMKKPGSGEPDYSDKKPENVLIQTNENKVLGTPSASEKAAHSTTEISFDPVKIWEQVLDALKRQDINGGEVRELSIQLHPAELGRVDVSMRMEDGQLHLIINASEQTTNNFLRSYLSELRESLSQIGVSCGSLQMGFQSSEQRYSGREYYGKSNSTGYKEIKPEINVLTNLFYYFQPLKENSRINISV